jgi:cell division septation protein DedD
MSGIVMRMVVTATVLFLAGCAGSEESAQEEQLPQQQETSPAVSFQMSTDTVDVLRRGERIAGVPADPEPGTMYSVQIGAYREPANAEAAEALARQRFAHPVLRHSDASGLVHIRVGRFSTRQGAEELRSEMKGSFPRDYVDCWIVQLKEHE